VKGAHPRILARALQVLLVDHDHRLVEHVVQLVLVERCDHNLSVAQRQREVRELPAEDWIDVTVCMLTLII
jgi:hypothetical protein